jgi:predicted Fe-S protein YdhL (DUF1289 family)
MASDRSEDEMRKEIREASIADETVASPCIGICKLDPLTKLCEGCFRTGEEISLWRDADNHWRRSVWQRIERRRAARASEAPGRTRQ